jgi:hypothetical protein
MMISVDGRIERIGMPRHRYENLTDSHIAHSGHPSRARRLTTNPGHQ